MNVKHKIHVEDQEIEGFIGLPPEWAEKLKESGISDVDIRDDPNAAMKALNYSEKSYKNEEIDISCLPDSIEIPEEKELLCDEDPSLKYLTERKIGQGAFGEVHIGRDNLTNRRVNIFHFAYHFALIFPLYQHFTIFKPSHN